MLHITPLPALNDNYIWLIHDEMGHAVVVDPGDASVVQSALAERQLTLKAILLTHHHDDHIGGVAALRLEHDVPVYAPVDDRIRTSTQRVGENDVITIDQPPCRFRVLSVPGHTLSHVAYLGIGALFCGDTLFSLGCGRLFEGSPDQMLASLDRLAALPGDTLICGGHEYTQANARFAKTIEPRNAELRARGEEVAALRSEGLPTLPVTLSSELACNPFLRVDSTAVTQWCEQQGMAGGRVERFAAVRAAKDAFGG